MTLLEDPSSSSSANPNPDVIIPWEGLFYGIACKSVSSFNAEGIKERVKEAVEQLEWAVEKGTVSAGRGVVFLDISALLNHDELYLPKEEGQVWSANALGEIMKHHVGEILGKIFGQETAEPTSAHGLFGDLFVNRPVAPAILVYAHSLMIAERNGTLAPYYAKYMQLLQAGDTSRIAKMADRLNRAIHAQDIEYS